MSLTPLSRLLTAKRSEAGPVTRDAGEEIAFARFHADIAANAQRLRAAGFRTALLVTRDVYWGAVGLFALLAAGIEPLLPPNLQPATVASLRCQAECLVTDRPLGTGAEFLLGRDGSSSAAFEPIPPYAPLTFLTSGSTGAPKRVAKTLAHLERECEAIDALLGKRVPADATILATVPHQHAYGLAFRLFWPLATGRPFQRTAHDLWETVLAAMEPGAVLVASPARLGRMGGLAPLDPERRPSLVLSAGAPLDDVAAMAAKAILGVPVTEIFGSTETGAIAYRVRDRDDPAWQPLPGITIGATKEGLVLVEGAQVPGGAHAGADRVLVDAAGGLRFFPRGDRVVKIEGARVSLRAMEERLSGLELVTDGAVIDLGGTLAAAAVLTPAGHAVLENIGPFRLGRRLRLALAKYFDPPALPRRWRFVSALPEGAMGKPDQKALSALFEAGNRCNVDAPSQPEKRDVRRTPDGVELDLFVAPSTIYLDGHFPGVPIVPAVAQIDWAMRLAAVHGLVQIEAAQTFQVKFRRVMVPAKPMTLSLRVREAPRRLTFEYRSENEVLSTGSIAL